MYLVRWRAGDKRRSWLHLEGFVGGRGLWTAGVSRGNVAAGGWLGPQELTYTVDGFTHVGEGLTDERAAHRLAEDRGEGGDAGHRALQAAHVPGGEIGDVAQHGGVGDLERHLRCHSPQKRGPRA